MANLWSTKIKKKVTFCLLVTPAKFWEVSHDQCWSILTRNEFIASCFLWKQMQNCFSKAVHLLSFIFEIYYLTCLKVKGFWKYLGWCILSVSLLIPCFSGVAAWWPSMKKYKINTIIDRIQIPSVFSICILRSFCSFILFFLSLKMLFYILKLFLSLYNSLYPFFFPFLKPTHIKKHSNLFRSFSVWTSFYSVCFKLFCLDGHNLSLPSACGWVHRRHGLFSKWP